MPVVLFRDGGGQARCLVDLCPHRSTPLSLGLERDGALECPYHGWRFDGDGRCVRLPVLAPGEAIPEEGTRCRSYPTRERDDVVWVWMGKQPPAKDREPPRIGRADPTRPFAVIEAQIEIGTHFSQVLSNLVDPAHVPFVHEHTLAKYGKIRGHQMRFFSLEERPDGTIASKARYEDETVTDDTPVYNHTIHSPFVVNDFFHDRGKDLILDFWYLAVPLTKDRSIYLFRQYRSFLTHPLAQRLVRRRFEKLAAAALDEDRRVLEGQYTRLSQGARFERLVQSDRMVARYQKLVNAREHVDTWFRGFGEGDRGRASVAQSSLGREPLAPTGE